ncbi:MAG TPA: polyprenyl diphosphate synthase [Woeseiaceae bacterium]|nr:polyprenyl diphosphate synthase [Woeseiaceae bacterium]
MPTSAPTDPNLPVHVAVIMDGNGRWARSRSRPRHAGHRAGVKSVRRTIEHAARVGIRHLTLFAFSSENFRRPADEVSALMALFLEALQREIAELHRNNVRLEFIGERGCLARGLVDKIENAERLTAANDGLHVIVAIAYGGRWDIANAAGRLALRVASGKVAPEAVDEAMLAAELQLGEIPDPDLLIRTGGERRISNFLLWHLAYAELWFTDVLWPDFAEADFDLALDFYRQRQRRYGHTGEQLEALKC